MSSDRVLLALAVVLSVMFIAIVCFRPTGTVDVWWTLEVGDYILAEGDVPRTALWTIEAVRDRPYVCHGWLPALMFSSAANTLGVDAVPGVPTLIALAVFGALIMLSRQLGASWLLSVAVADLVLYVVSLRMICRAEVFAYLYFSLALILIAAYARTQRVKALAWLLPLAILWVNSHASFLLLSALLALAAVGISLDRWRRERFRLDALLASLLSRSTATLGVVGFLVAATTLINPYGIGLLRSVLEPGQTDSITRLIGEWQPLYAAGSLPPRFFVPAGLMAGALLIGFRRLSFVSLLLSGSLVALALSAERHITFFGIGAVYLLGDFAAGLELGRRGRTAVAVALVAGLLAANALAIRGLGLGNRSLAAHPSPDVTSRGLEFINRHVRGNVLNSYSLGGLLIYFTYPQIRVSMDSRADPYPPAYHAAYQNALYGTTAHATRAFVDRHAIDHIIVARRTYERIVRPKLSELSDFRLVYQDELTVVLSRSDRRIGYSIR